MPLPVSSQPVPQVRKGPFILPPADLMRPLSTGRAVAVPAPSHDVAAATAAAAEAIEAENAAVEEEANLFAVDGFAALRPQTELMKVCALFF